MHDDLDGPIGKLVLSAHKSSYILEPDFTGDYLKRDFESCKIH